MRKVIFAINISIDGCVDHTYFRPPDDVSEYFTAFVQEMSLIAYGRKTYQLMFPYWAEEANRDDQVEVDFAERLTRMEKIVFSRSLESAEYNTRVVSTDPGAELLKLKQAPGGPIAISTVSMLPQLAQAGVIDEYRFMVHPVIVGRGKKLIEGDLTKNLGLKLASSKIFQSGAIALHYLTEEQ